MKYSSNLGRIVVEYEPWAEMFVALLFLEQKPVDKKGLFFCQQNDSWSKEIGGQ